MATVSIVETKSHYMRMSIPCQIFMLFMQTSTVLSQIWKIPVIFTLMKFHSILDWNKNIALFRMAKTNLLSAEYCLSVIVRYKVNEKFDMKRVFATCFNFLKFSIFHIFCWNLQWKTVSTEHAEKKIVKLQLYLHLFIYFELFILYRTINSMLF